MPNPTNNPKDREQQSQVGKSAAAVAEETRKTAQSIKERAEETAHSLSEKASEGASAVRDRADDALESAGEHLHSFGEKMREKGPREGTLGSVNESLAGSIEKAGSYLESHGLGDMTDDLTDLIRRNPIPALLVGIGVGYLIARATRS